ADESEPEPEPDLEPADELSDEEDEAEAAQRYPLALTRKMTVLDNVGGFAAVLVTGLRPMLVLVGAKRYARVHPIRVPVRLPLALQPADLPRGADAEAVGLLTSCRPLVGAARFHSSACERGVVVLTQAGTLVVARLPTSLRAARGGIEFDSPWPVRSIPVGTTHGGISTQGGVAFHAGSGSYAVAAATPSQFFIREPNPDIAFKQATDAANADGRAPPAARIVIPEYQRRNLQTTSAPPLVPRFAIDLLNPETWETIDSYALDEHEHVAAMHTLELESAQSEGGRRALLCVGTGFVLGEDVMSRGRVYVFDIVHVVPQPGRPQTNRKLKLLYTEEIHGAVSALGELRGNLVMSEGSRVYVRSFNGDTLTSFAFLDGGAWVRAAVGLRNFLLVADISSGLSFVGFQEENPARLHVLGRDAHARLPVECAEFLVLGRQLQLLAADVFGNLHLFVYAPHDVHSFGGQRLLRRGEFSLRSRVVALRRIAADTGRQACLAITASGAVHAVTMVPETTFKRLHRINAQLVHGIPPLAGLNPREFRAVPLHQRQNHAPRRTVLDADLLVPLYAHGPVARQREAAQRDGTTTDRVLRDIIDTESAPQLAIDPSPGAEVLTLQQRRALAAAAHAERSQPASPMFHESTDPTLEFFYHPRTLSVLVALVAGFLYVALWVDPSNDMLNTKWGLGALCSVFVVVSVVLFRDGPFIRPHPAFWRAVLALNVLYEMFLVFLLFQSKHTGRQIMQFFDADLGVELPERSYGEDCAVTWENIRNGMDIFVLAHSLGWFGKALIIRNHTMCWILSVAFELAEYSLAHQLPNFHECWWDHWILDVLLCNWLGIYVGMKWCEHFKMKTYTWHGIREIPSLRGKLSRAGAQFTPHSWTVYRWAPTRRFKSFAGFVLFAVLIMLAELNVFYLKSLLWVPPEHPLVTARLALLFLFALPSAREYYEYYSNPGCKRMGAHCWVLIATLLTELLIIVKFARGEFTEPFPRVVVVFWALVAAALAGFSLWQFALRPRLRRTPSRRSKKAN
ncbi:hypothetical protein IWW52_004642, partial [Coemansia sp. RSA 2704]